MNILTEEDYLSIERIINNPEIDHQDMLTLIAYYTWNKYHISFVTNNYQVYTLSDLINKLKAIGLNQNNFVNVMGLYHQANAWFTAHESQREYDNHITSLIEEEDCPECEGKGHLDQSNCCGAEIDSDHLICHECKEHSDFEECDNCDSTGKIPISTEPKPE